MGYEGLEKDSLLTLMVALERYRENVVEKTSQGWKDVTYELDRIKSELDSRW